jgi:hypothetical protein
MHATFVNINDTLFSYIFLPRGKRRLKHLTPVSLLLHTLPTPLVLHPNLHRRLRELLLRLALAVHLVPLAGRIAADVLLSVPSKIVSINQSCLPLHNLSELVVVRADLLSRLLAVSGLHVQLVLFASGVVGVGDLAFGLAAGVS